MSPAPDPATILVVDDEDMVRNLIVLILRSSGYKLLEAVNATEAVAACRSHPVIDLAIVDYMLPDSSGVSLFQALGSSFPKIKLIMISGYPDVGVPRSFALGNLIAHPTFLQKPFAPDSLRAAVEIALSGPAAFRA